MADSTVGKLETILVVDDTPEKSAAVAGHASVAKPYRSMRFRK
jgi:hypothetical protein